MKEFPQVALVTVATMAMIGAGPHPSVELGRSNVQAVPHSIVLGPAHVIAGGVVSTTVTIWLQVLLLPQASVALQVRVAVKVFPQPAFVTVPTMAIVGVDPHTSLALGVSNVQPVPHSMVLGPT